MLVPKAYKKFKRGPQVILPKDMGFVITYTGIGKNSVCVDAGCGSGWLAVTLAKVCKHVTSYEKNKEFIKIAEHNMRIAQLDNLDIVEADVMEGIKEREVDLVSLDMPDSDKVIPLASIALKRGGYIFGYLPHMEQVKRFVESLSEHGFETPTIMEVIVRDFLVRKEGMRPSTKGVWHTAYLVFSNKRD